MACLAASRTSTSRRWSSRCVKPARKRLFSKVSPSGKVPCLEHGGTVDLGQPRHLRVCSPRSRPRPRCGRPTARPAPLARAISAEMHSGFASCANRCRWTSPRRCRRPRSARSSKRDIRRIVAIWGEARRRYGKGGPFLLGALQHRGRHVRARRIALHDLWIDLGPFGDDGTAEAYRAAHDGACRRCATWGSAAGEE